MSLRSASVLVSTFLLAGACGGSDESPAVEFESRWLRTFGGPGNDIALGCDLDDQGNVFVVGRYDGGAQFGDVSVPAGGGIDAFLARYDAAGGSLDVQSFAGDSTQVLETVEVVGNRVMAGGRFSGTVDWGNGDVTAQSFFDSVVLSQNTGTSGTDWVNVGGGTGVGRVTSMAAAGGDLFVTGYFSGELNLSGCQVAQTGDESEDLFVARLDAIDGGTCVWLESYATAGQDRGNGIAAPTETNRPVTVGGRINGLPLDQPTGFGAVLGSFNKSNGVSETSTDFPFVPNDAVAAGTATCFAGRGNGTLSFGDVAIETDDTDGLVACVGGALGDARWISQVGGTSTEDLRAVSHDDGLVVGAGRFAGTANVGGQEWTAQGTHDGFLAAFLATDGAVQGGAAAATGGGDLVVYDVAVKGGTVCMVGEYSDELVVGAETASSADQSVDGFVAVFDIVRN